MSRFFLGLALFLSCASQPGAPETLSFGTFEPLDYVALKVDQNDIVFLGELHEQKETLAFVAQAIPRMHGAGMRVFATEFLRSRNTLRANALVTAATFDREEGVRLFRDFAWLWAFEGYLDILEAIWRVNAEATKAEDKIRVVGLDFEWQDWSGAKVETAQDRDVYMAERLMEEWSPGRKAVVHCGHTHTLMSDRLERPTLAKEVAKRTSAPQFHITLHHLSVPYEDAPTLEFSLSDSIDRMLERRLSIPFAFDVKGSSLEHFRDNVTWYFHFSDESLSSFTDGYIVLKNSHALGRTRTIDGFVDETNFKKALEIIKTRNWFSVDEDRETIASINAKLKRFMDGT